jgi:hypothetical protein
MSVTAVNPLKHLQYFLYVVRKNADVMDRLAKIARYCMKQTGFYLHLYSQQADYLMKDDGYLILHSFANISTFLLNFIQLGKKKIFFAVIRTFLLNCIQLGGNIFIICRQ